MYLTKDAKHENINPNTPKIVVGTATGSIQNSSNGCTISMENIPMEANKAHTMSNTQKLLIGIVPLYNAGFTVNSTHQKIVVNKKPNKNVLEGCRE